MKRQHNTISSKILCAVFETTVLRELCDKFNSKSYRNYYDCFESENMSIPIEEISLLDHNKLRELLIDRCEYAEFDLINHIKAYMKNVMNNTSYKYYNEVNQIPFFRIVFDFADSMISKFDGKYCFNYQYTDLWITTIRCIGEELLVTAKAVLDDIRCNNNSPDFNWNHHIEHNNHELKMMLNRGDGVSENHFHLRSSSPYFDISWIYLMNDVVSERYENSLKLIQEHPLNPNSLRQRDYPLMMIWRKAASLRKVLYDIIKNEEVFVSIERYNEPYIFADYILSRNGQKCDVLDVEKIVKYIGCFQGDGIDYAAQNHLNSINDCDFFSGERYIIYHSLKRIVTKQKNYRIISSYLFLYLMMKNHLYCEMVQCNKRNGFYNFNLYQARKDLFIPWENERNVAAETIYSVLNETKIHSFELRIYPSEDEKELASDIKTYIAASTDAIKRLSKNHSIFKYKEFPPCYFVLHFIKETDRHCEMKQCSNCIYRNEPRYKELRDRIRRQTYSITNLHPSYLQYIRGIDAAGEEIKCRPEVFGVNFRRLLHYMNLKSPSNSCCQLKATYHVGEDNYDLLDGIRAIHEAVLFLDLRSGCRLGHATLLGNPVDEYYNSDRNPIAIPRQVFLDNIVWMYYYISENELKFEGSELLFDYIKHHFNIHFDKIFEKTYRLIMDKNDNNSELDKSLHYYQERKYVNQMDNKFDDYYLSYLLRGDDPELYREYYNDCSLQLSLNNEFRICKTHSRMNEARRLVRARYLCYLYQFDCEVKLAGEEVIYEKLPDFFIRGVMTIQKHMRHKISFWGIAIETNPTSNLLISNFNKMDQHPLTFFYDHMLTKDGIDVQMNVSINTDDKSIFSTSLSNEYAYLMYYLESKKENGKYLYSRFNILQWLNSIREMGNEQSFMDNDLYETEKYQNEILD